jgi:nucleoid DNA-binding protein
MKLKKADFVAQIVEKFAGKYTKSEVQEIVNSFLALFTDNLKDNQRITIAPLGTFFNRVRKERTIKHPKTGEMVDVKKGLVPAFKPSVTIKRNVNETA